MSNETCLSMPVLVFSSRRVGLSDRGDKAMTVDRDGRWALLSNHGHILLYVAEHPDATISEVSDAVGLTERATARILSDLRQAGFIGATRLGRRNTYHIDPLRPLRPQITERELRVGDL